MNFTEQEARTRDLHMQVRDDAERLRASRLAALLGALQQLDYVAETLGQYIFGERAAWLLLTILEAWKALCRLRLLTHSQPGRLMSSFPRDEETQESWSSVIGRLSASTALSPLRKREHAASGGNHRSGSRTASWLLHTGEVLHVLQPLVYLALIQLQPSRHRSGWRRRAPWLFALVMEAAGLQLCSMGLRQAERERLATGGYARIGAPAVDAEENARELRHRLTLVVLFLARPAARAAARRVLSAGARAGSGRPGGGYLASCCAAALELVDQLETAPWARYFRTAESQQPSRLAYSRNVVSE
jgi:hypothetical protein